MKKIVLVLMVIAGVIAAGVVAVFVLTAGIADTADRFFNEVAEGDYQSARTYLAEAFLANTSDEELALFLDQSGLSGYRKASWHTRTMENDQGLLEGSIETADGGTIPVTVNLVKEDGEWHILAIHKTPAGLVAEGRTKEIPGLDRLVKLTDDAIQELARAINTRDFSDFYASAAKLWQAQTTEAELRGAFGSFVEQGIDLTVLADLEPVFSEKPSLDEDGVLYLTGYYPSQPAVTYFDLKYIYEHPEWKLLGAGVELK
jgi:hypothetical protein